MREEKAWLIGGDGPVWWTGGGYTDDSLKAIRYARQQDAEKQIECWREVAALDAEFAELKIDRDYLKATEHIWNDL